MCDYHSITKCKSPPPHRHLPLRFLHHERGGESAVIVTSNRYSAPMHDCWTCPKIPSEQVKTGWEKRVGYEMG